MHGVFGNVLQLVPLATRLTTERPVVAIQARGADPELEPHSTIDEMVEAYLAAIREVQPQGPYHLAGYSFGGLVAFRIACRMRAAGERVALMALIETDLHHRLLPAPHKLAYAGVLAIRVLRKLCATPPSGWRDYLVAKVLQLRRTLAPPPQDFEWPLEEVPADLRQRYREIYAIGLRAFHEFEPDRFDGTLHLFMTTGPRFDACDPRPIWKRAAKALQVIAISGEHTTVMDPHNVSELAVQLSACLAATAASGRVARRSGTTASTSDAPPPGLGAVQAGS